MYLYTELRIAVSNCGFGPNTFDPQLQTRDIGSQPDNPSRARNRLINEAPFTQNEHTEFLEGCNKNAASPENIFPVLVDVTRL